MGGGVEDEPHDGSLDGVVSPQSHSSAPVRVPSPQRGMQFDFCVWNPLSVSW